MSSVGGTDDMPRDDVGFIISSHYRVFILDGLSEGPATPTQVATDSKSAITHVSRTLQELRDRLLAELFVPEQRREGRVYDATDDAESIRYVI